MEPAFHDGFTESQWKAAKNQLDWEAAQGTANMLELLGPHPHKLDEKKQKQKEVQIFTPGKFPKSVTTVHKLHELHAWTIQTHPIPFPLIITKPSMVSILI